MCGITGILNYENKEPVDQFIAARMTDAIKHRGPDDQGHYFSQKDGLFLGHRRLSIIDLSSGHQPMVNEDNSVWIIFNGEIYNFQELRHQLKSYGHVFKTKSDTEVIIHGYEQWGVEAFSKLNGMFAFALWDENKKLLILARDPFGVKPLYYWDNGKTLVFGSEIRAILNYPEVVRQPDLSSLRNFISLTYVPSPKTLFSGIHKLAPGEMLICRQSYLEKRQIQYSVPITFTGRLENDLKEELQFRIFNAIKRQMIADVPIGAMLSGGVDSSTLVTIMNELYSGPIKTFTVGFSDDFDENELGFAREIVNRIGSDHFDIKLSFSDYIEKLPKAVWHLEEPIATTSALAFYLISDLASKHVKVVLTGQGADEPFAGYHRHLGEYYGSYFRLLPKFVQEKVIQSFVEKLPRNERLKRAVRSLGESDPVKRLMNVYNTVDQSLLNGLFQESILGDDYKFLQEIISTRLPRGSRIDNLNQMLYVDARLPLADNLLLYSDKMSMAVSLEARVPFLDIELMDFVERLPAKLKINAFRQKYLLKKAAVKWIPRTVIKRKKIGFATPVDQWFQNEMSQIVHERLLSPGSACTQYLNSNTIKQMLSDHQNRKQDHKRVLFSFLTFEIWYEQFIKQGNF